MPIVLEVDSKEFDPVPEFYRVVRIAENEIRGPIGQEVGQRVEIESSSWPLY